VLVSDVDFNTLKLLLTYLYTGTCTYVIDDLELGVSLLRCASRFMLEGLISVCERKLLAKMSNDNVIDLYRVAALCQAPILLASTRHHILVNYKQLSARDPNHEALLEVLQEQGEGMAG